MYCIAHAVFVVYLHFSSLAPLTLHLMLGLARDRSVRQNGLNPSLREYYTPYTRQTKRKFTHKQRSLWAMHTQPFSRICALVAYRVAPRDRLKPDLDSEINIFWKKYIYSEFTHISNKRTLVSSPRNVVEILCIGTNRKSIQNNNNKKTNRIDL